MTSEDFANRLKEATGRDFGCCEGRKLVITPSQAHYGKASTTVIEIEGSPPLWTTFVQGLIGPAEKIVVTTSGKRYTNQTAKGERVVDVALDTLLDYHLDGLHRAFEGEYLDTIDKAVLGECLDILYQTIFKEKDDPRRTAML
jgi:hypothetical protein